MEEVKELTDAQQIAERVCKILMAGIQPIPEFAQETVPIKFVANLMKKDVGWVQAGIICGWLPIGYATLDGKLITDLKEIRSNRRVNYTIIPKKLWEVTGYVWKGREETGC